MGAICQWWYWSSASRVTVNRDKLRVSPGHCNNLSGGRSSIQIHPDQQQQNVDHARELVHDTKRAVTWGSLNRLVTNYVWGKKLLWRTMMSLRHNSNSNWSNNNAGVGREGRRISLSEASNKFWTLFVTWAFVFKQSEDVSTSRVSWELCV